MNDGEVQCAWLRIRRKNKKTENRKKQCLATLKRLMQGDDNELEKMVATAQLMLALIEGVVVVGVVLSLNTFRKVGNYAYHSNLII